MKRCCICKQDKEVSDFSWKSRRKCQRANECKECHQKIRKTYYLRHKKEEIQSVESRKNINAAWLREYKNQIKCCKCGENHIAVLQFHHRDPFNKDVSISQAVHHMKWGLKRIQNELQKCDILCANCHFKLHYELNHTGAAPV